MPTIEELLERINRLEDDLKKTKSENLDLRNKLGIRGYLKPPSTSDKPTAEPMDSTPTVNNGETATGNRPSEKKPPPFFITGIKSMSIFQSLIKKSGIEISEMKALLGGELKVQTPSVDEYRKLKATLDNPCPDDEADRKQLGVLRYHTYRLPADKPFTVYIRHLHPSADEKEIKAALLEYGHQTSSVTNVQIRKIVNEKATFIKLPLFKVDIQPSGNNRDIFNLKSLLYHKIAVEYPRKSTEVAQCKRCQQVGHSKNYCSKIARCVKCGERHEFKDCKLPRSAPAKCANCLGPHTASYRGCPAFKSRKTQGNSQSAVQRILAEKSPAGCESRNQTNTNAQEATTKDNKTYTKPTNSGASDNTIKSTELSEILIILRRLESSQDVIKNSVSKLDERVNKLEAANAVSSPKRKVRKV